MSSLFRHGCIQNTVLEHVISVDVKLRGLVYVSCALVWMWDSTRLRWTATASCEESRVYFQTCGNQCVSFRGAGPVACLQAPFQLCSPSWLMWTGRNVRFSECPRNMQILGCFMFFLLSLLLWDALSWCCDCSQTAVAWQGERTSSRKPLQNWSFHKSLAKPVKNGV